jgi:hypothetical protein
MLIKINVKEVCYDGVDWISMTQGRIQWRLL